MRRLWALVFLAASACADGGVVIEVTPTDPSIDTVRLFIGQPQWTEDVTLEVPTQGPNGLVHTEVPGVTYFPRDANNELDTKAIKSGETVKFVLVRSDTIDLGAIIAVGYAGPQIKQVATLFDVHLPATHFDQYTMKLAAPAQKPVAWSEASPGPDTEATCIGVTDPQQKDPFAVSYIVTPGDQDCDGLANDDPRECNKDAWFGKRPASLDELRCIVTNIDNASCYLGGPECTDGEPKATQAACVPTKYCVPKQVCSACAGNLSCAEDITTNPAATPFDLGFDCNLRIENGDACEDELVLTMEKIDGLDCTDASIGDAMHPFSDHIDLDKQSIYVKVDPGCQIRLVVKGSAPDSNTANIGLMIAIDLDNGRGVAVPVVLHVDRQTNGCARMPVACSLDANVAGPDLADCAAPWSAPVQEPGLVPAGATYVLWPSLTADQLDIWVVSDLSRVWHARRTSKIAPWSPLEAEPTLSSNAAEATTAGRVSPDGLTFYLSGGRNGTIGGDDIFVATRATRTSPWSQLVPAGAINTMRDEFGGSVDGSGHLFAFSGDSEAGVTPSSRLFLATRTAVSSGWDVATELAGAGAATNDYNPHLTADGQRLYFSSDAVQSLGRELFVIERGQGGTSFGPARRLAALSSNKSEVDPWVSADQRTIYFASDRGTGTYRIYKATR